MADRIQIRRDNSATWTSVNPILAQAELGYELDTGKVKVGDGTTVWTSLPYSFLSVTDHGALTGLSDDDHAQYLNNARHSAIRQLTHIINAPAESFSGAYQTVAYSGAFVSSVTWWLDNTATVKIYDAVYTRNGFGQATTVVHKIYDVPGTTVLATATDTITYTGAKMNTRTRVIT